jgi:hypothetical protein
LKPFFEVCPQAQPCFYEKKRYKNSSYEYFSVDNYKLCLFPKLAPEKVVLDVQRRYTGAKQNFFINNIVLVAKAGSLLVFYNKEAVSVRSNKMNKSFA